MSSDTKMFMINNIIFYDFTKYQVYVFFFDVQNSTEGKEL